MADLLVLKNESIENASKEDLLRAVDNYLEEVSLNGGDPLRDVVMCKKIIFMLNELEKGLKDMAISELSNFDKEQTNLLGTFVKKIDAGVKYDYSANEDWVNQKEYLDIHTDKLKKIEQQLKDLSEPTMVVNEDNEEYMLYPPIRSCTPTIKVVID